MVYRAYVEKKNGLANEAQALKNELVSLLGITSLENVRILNRYDLEGLEKELFDYAKTTVLRAPARYYFRRTQSRMRQTFRNRIPPRSV